MLSLTPGKLPKNPAKALDPYCPDWNRGVLRNGLRV